MRTLLVSALLLATAAAAEASTSRRIERVDEDHARLKVVVTTSARGMQEVILPITVPDGMVVTGLSITVGREAPMVARPLLAASARNIYDQVVREIRDPALLETTETGGFQLSVFPVTRAAPARVVIELTAIDKVEGLAHVTHATSLVAAPMMYDRDDPYADYWPEHRSPDVVVEVNDPD